MSLLSQFFPSGGGAGGGGGGIAQKIEILLVGGGGGGGASGGSEDHRWNCGGGVQLTHDVGGGGGGGQVVVSDAYEVLQDVSYPIVIGGGGAGGDFDYDPNRYNSANPCNPNGCLSYTNAGGQQGINGGNTCFGTLIAYGGGGGGAGHPACVVTGLFPTVCEDLCQRCALNCNPRLTSRGADGGTGGGAGSGALETGHYPGAKCTPNPDYICGLENRPKDSRPGRAIYNHSNETSKLGQDGITFALMDGLRLCEAGASPNTTPDLGFKAYASYATGGGGNQSIAGNSYICLCTPKASAQKFYCIDDATGETTDANSEVASASDLAKGYYSLGYCEIGVPGQPFQYAFGYSRSINAFMEGYVGGVRGCANQVNNINDWMGTLRGGDGYHTHITPTPEYYGGGGGVAYSAIAGGPVAPTPSRKAIIGATMAPGNPLYTNYDCVWCDNPKFVHQACPFGGLGGGGSAKMLTAVTAINCLGVLYSNANACICSFPGGEIVGIETVTNNNVNITGPTGVFLAGALCGCDGCGGGGASLSAGEAFVSTGNLLPPAVGVAATSCAFSGYSGGSGAVIIRYPTVYCEAVGVGTAAIAPQAGFHVYKWTSSGSITFPSS